MTTSRLKQLMDDTRLCLSPDEQKDGWHFCNDFDGLVVGPGMMETTVCQCFGPRPIVPEADLVLVKNPF